MACKLLDDLREFESSNLSFKFPSGEASGLVVHVTISCDGFDSDSDDFGIVKDYSGVVERSLIENWGSKLNNNFISDTRFENILDDVPRMKNSIIFSEMISTTIPGDFKLTADSECAV